MAVPWPAETREFTAEAAAKLDQAAAERDHAVAKRDQAVAAKMRLEQELAELRRRLGGTGPNQTA